MGALLSLAAELIGNAAVWIGVVGVVLFYLVAPCALLAYVAHIAYGPTATAVVVVAWVCLMAYGFAKAMADDKG